MGDTATVRPSADGTRCAHGGQAPSVLSSTAAGRWKKAASSWRDGVRERLTSRRCSFPSPHQPPAVALICSASQVHIFCFGLWSNAFAAASAAAASCCRHPSSAIHSTARQSANGSQSWKCARLPMPSIGGLKRLGPRSTALSLAAFRPTTALVSRRRGKNHSPLPPPSCTSLAPIYRRQYVHRPPTATLLSSSTGASPCCPRATPPSRCATTVHTLAIRTRHVFTLFAPTEKLPAALRRGLCQRHPSPLTPQPSPANPA